jgi:hypothetical protein
MPRRRVRTGCVMGLAVECGNERATIWRALTYQLRLKSVKRRPGLSEMSTPSW